MRHKGQSKRRMTAGTRYNKCGCRGSNAVGMIKNNAARSFKRGDARWAHVRRRSISGGCILFGRPEDRNDGSSQKISRNKGDNGPNGAGHGGRTGSRADKGKLILIEGRGNRLGGQYKPGPQGVQAVRPGTSERRNKGSQAKTEDQTVRKLAATLARSQIESACDEMRSSAQDSEKNQASSQPFANADQHVAIDHGGKGDGPRNSSGEGQLASAHNRGNDGAKPTRKCGGENRGTRVLHPDDGPGQLENEIAGAHIDQGHVEDVGPKADQSAIG